MIVYGVLSILEGGTDKPNGTHRTPNRTQNNTQNEPSTNATANTQLNRHYTQDNIPEQRPTVTTLCCRNQYLYCTVLYRAHARSLTGSTTPASLCCGGGGVALSVPLACIARSLSCTPPEWRPLDRRKKDVCTSMLQSLSLTVVVLRIL